MKMSSAIIIFIFVCLLIDSKYFVKCLSDQKDSSSSWDRDIDDNNNEASSGKYITYTLYKM